MKIEYNQNYHLDVTVDQVPDKQLYRLTLSKLDPMSPKFNSKQEYYFEAHQLKQLANYVSEVANGIN